MKAYDCNVRLNGSLLHTVVKTGISAAEIAVLRHIHGHGENANDPVFDIKESKAAITRKESQERAYLAGIYSHGDVSGAQIVQNVLGVAGVPLPQYIEGIDEPEAAAGEDIGAVEAAVPAERPVRTRIDRDARGRITSTKPETTAEAAA